MPRQYVLNGETLVEVRGGCHLSGGAIGTLSELGLSIGQVIIEPQINNKAVLVNDFGPDVPADILSMLSSVKISMVLIHYDPVVLDLCISESMAIPEPFNFIEVPPQEGQLVALRRSIGGVLGPGGQYLGGLKRIFWSGWHYISLNLTSTVQDEPWTFPKCYLNHHPVKIPIGNDLSEVYMEFTAIPYFDPYQSGVSGYGDFITTNQPYPYQLSGGDPIFMTLRGDTPSSGAILWTRVRDSTDGLIIPMN